MPYGWVRAAAVILLLVASVRAQSASSSSPRVESVRFDTPTTMPTVTVRPQMEPLRALIEKGAGHVSEGSLLVGGIALGQKWFALTPPQVAALTGGFKEAYAKIAADPAMKNLPSVLSEAISQDAARGGHYFLYGPATPAPQTPAIIFLHGFGGNFQFYTWALKEAFGDHVILAPSYGIAWSPAGRAYLGEVVDDAERRLGMRLHSPWLIALSAGGPAGFDIYNAAPDRYAGLICLASCPDPRRVRDLKAGLNILMINGMRDDRFPIAVVRNVVAQVAALHLHTAELDSDHFFLLTDREKTVRLMRRFMTGNSLDR